MERATREETRQALETTMTNQLNSSLQEPPPLVPNLVTPTQTRTSPTQSSSSQPPLQLQLLQPSLVLPTQASAHSSEKRKKHSAPKAKLQLCHNFSSSFSSKMKKKRLKNSSKVFARNNNRNAGKGKRIQAHGKYGVTSTICRGAELFARCK
jgi:hypothetical protein